MYVPDKMMIIIRRRRYETTPLYPHLVSSANIERTAGELEIVLQL